MSDTTKAKADLARRMADRRRELIARPLAEIWEELAAVAMDGSDPAPGASPCGEEVEPDELADMIADRSSDRAADLIVKNFAVFRRDAAPVPQSAATTVEPVAWRAKNEFGYWFTTEDPKLAATWRDVEMIEVHPLYAAPTTSPEPMTVETIDAAFASYKTTLTIMDPKADHQSFSQGYVAGWNAKEAQGASPEPDAVREALVKIAFDAEVNGLHGNPAKWPSTIAYLALGGRISKGVHLDTEESLAALSRPAHGGGDAIEALKPFADHGREILRGLEHQPDGVKLTVTEPFTIGQYRAAAAVVARQERGTHE